MIRIRQLTKHVGADRIPVLRNISADIQSGEFISLVGPSGSGKSTLLRCLALKETWDGGSLIINGEDILKQGISGKLKQRQEWAFLEQNPYVNLNRTALKNVLIGRAGQTPVWRMITGMVRSDDYMGAMDTLEQLGLLDKAHDKCEKLSGGERQRVAIARALVHGAKVILADEPVNGLDPAAADRVLDTLRTLCKQERITVISVLPLETAERFASRIWGLQGGEIVFDVQGRRLTFGEKNML
ncbi:ATP-binding cassette domain-containing protein [Paenibacillus sp. P96]|uniref:ATP-binding cassette domain-containing protein n=1 Tax=Paenibacillus zeirhizosphaerae TaxID=2987519 RepID=A0ABT9FVZ7_9BACL|nr:ATP-binding cassette domain-containing protein [Paenibacillus sp. P96]MDP4098652.1 ATP-binding cassette domain-containing protein [Paenibacillus sp. P96]